MTHLCTMNIRVRLCAAAFAAVCAAGCRQVPEVAGFDRETWLADPDGCLGQRAQVWKDFEAQKNNLRGYSENNLKLLLGVPAEKNLLEKGQKVYAYPISGSAACPQQGPRQLLQLRVNATGYVSEVQVINPGTTP